jgi:hypothetical protein
LYHKAKLKERKREREPNGFRSLGFKHTTSKRFESGPKMGLFSFFFFFFFFGVKEKILGDEDENWYRLETRRVCVDEVGMLGVAEMKLCF